MLPELAGDAEEGSEKAGKNANTKMSNYIRALQPAGRDGALDKYNEVAVHSLPPQPTAGGLRPGASDTMALCIPAEFTVHTTGHDLAGSCGSLFTYLDTRQALQMPGALALADWPPYPYGQIGPGPRSPTLEVLLNLGDRGGKSVSMESLESFIDKLFSFHDATHPGLLQDGALRSLMHASTATLIMYYEERFEAKEMHVVLTSMREAFAKPPNNIGNLSDAHFTLIEWSKAIRGQFDVDNLHLTARQAHDNSQQVITAVQHLHGAHASLRLQVAEIAARQVRIEDGQGQIIEMLTRLLSHRDGPVSPAAAIAGAPVAGAPVTGAPPIAAISQNPSVAPGPLIPLIPRPRPPHLPQPGQGIGAGAVAATYELPTGPGQFYLDCLNQCGKGPLEVPFIKDDDKGKRRCDAKKVLAAYVAMTLPEEHALLTSTPRQMTICGPVVTQLTSLIVAIIKHSYTANRIVCPKEFGKGGAAVKVNTLVANLRDSKIIIESGFFRRWRAQRNSPGGGSSSGVGERRAAEDEPDASPVRKSPRPLGPPGKEDPLASGGSGEEDDSGEEDGGEEEEEEEEDEGQGSPAKPIDCM